MKNVVILDCYTDEPSGYGVRPFLGSHQIHLSQSLAYLGINHVYITIEDLRYNFSILSANPFDTYSREFLHTTNNRDQALKYISDADIIYVIMGCFVDYEYFSSVPPKSDEVLFYLENTKAKKILFYVMASENRISDEYTNSRLKRIVDYTEIGNTYRYILEQKKNGENFVKPNYELLAKISRSPVPIIDQIKYPIIAEIETGSGCNTPTCSFCIEAARKFSTVYREPEDIIYQIRTLYNLGVRHFRLGRQPNFYHYQKYNTEKLESLLYGIRAACPKIETLHVDNVNIIDVIRPHGIQFTKLIAKYCTSANVTPFGIESFDNIVRKETKVVGTADNVIQAIEIINESGQERDTTGFPKLLPGINLIYGLPGQTSHTHEINMRYLQKILDLGLQTQRLYYRRMTRSTGVSFEDGPDRTEDFNNCYDMVINNFVMPMQKRVYPEGNILKGFREAIYKNGKSQLRTLGTCSIRVQNKNDEFLTPYARYDVKVIGHIGPRLLDVEIINRNT